MDHEAKIFSEMKRLRLRLTRTRRAFVAVLLGAATPLSASHILARLEQDGLRVNKTTVYREIERLEQLGIIVGVELGDRQKYYEYTLTAHHHHLVCTKCERIEDVAVDERALMVQEKAMAHEKHFRILRHSLEFFGLCWQCQKTGC